LFALYAYPGLMTMDSFDQLEEARAGFYTDSHPPAMALVWKLVDALIAGPFGMLVIQSTAFLAGLYLLLRRVMAPRAAGITASLLFLCPPVVAPLAVIWKDCLMAGSLLLGAAWLADDRRSRQLLGLGACFVATSMRYNAFAATLPLVVLLFQWRPELRWWQRYGIAIGAWLALTVCALGLNGAITDRKMYFWYSTFALADITGTLANVDDTIPDDELRPLLAPTQIQIDSGYHDALRARYKPETFTQLLAGDTALWHMPIRGTTPAPVEQRDAIGHAWREILTSHPGAYVRYRFQVFAEVLGLPGHYQGGGVTRRHWQTPERLAALGIESSTSWYQKRIERYLFTLGKQTGLFHAWPYMLLSLALLAFCRGRRLTFAVLTSGLVMELSLLPLAVTPDYRYSHWLVVCTCVGAVMLIAQRAREPT
jgi:hypothetical protein